MPNGMDKLVRQLAHCAALEKITVADQPTNCLIFDPDNVLITPHHQDIRRARAMDCPDRSPRSVGPAHPVCAGSRMFV